MDKSYRDKPLRGRIFNIERYATKDGPGIRTTVFLKGCALRCRWCANPESQEYKKEILFFKGKCAACLRCLSVCPYGAVASDAVYGFISSGEKCKCCKNCAAKCVSGAREVSGEDMGVEELVDFVEKDAPFYRASGGGVTLSGGEPFLQGEFTCEVLRVCKNRGIGTAVETCGHAPWESIEVSLEHIDILFFDIKHVDNLVHREWTGAGNELIKENLLRIDGHDSTPELVIRIPFIPGFNGGEKTIREILSLVQGLKKIAFVEILPYHRLGWGKYEALGRGYSLKELAPVKRDSLTDIVAAGADYGLEVRIA